MEDDNSYEGSVSAFDHIAVDAESQEEAEKLIREKAKRQLRGTGFQIHEVVDVEDVSDVV